MAINRSAKTGRIVSKKFADANPDTTFSQETNKEITMANKDTSKTKTAVGEKGDKKPDGAIKKDGVNVEVTVEKQGAGSQEDKTPDGQVADGSETPPNAPTPTQIIATPPKPIVTHEDGRDQKVVRHDDQPGTGVPTTVVEEVVIHEKAGKAEDLDGEIAAMRVLAATQGVNQSKVLSDGKVLTVMMDGTHRIDEAEKIEIRKDDEVEFEKK